MDNIKERLDEALYESLINYLRNAGNILSGSKYPGTETKFEKRKKNPTKKDIKYQENPFIKGYSKAEGDVYKKFKSLEMPISDKLKLAADKAKEYVSGAYNAVKNMPGKIEKAHKNALKNSKDGYNSNSDKPKEIGAQHVLAGAMAASALGLGANVLYKKYKRKKKKLDDEKSKRGK